jgi:hypothetical protein
VAALRMRFLRMARNTPQALNLLERLFGPAQTEPGIYWYLFIVSFHFNAWQRVVKRSFKVSPVAF